MIRRLYIILGIFGMLIGASAQKTALVDMEYIFSKMPTYASANKKVEEQSKKWQDEVARLEQEAADLYKRFQQTNTNLTAQQRQEQEEIIVAKEKAAYNLKRKYFGANGDLAKYREQVFKPLQDKVWAQIKSLAMANGITLVLDRGTGKIIYADPAVDFSSIVLEQMGYAENERN